MKKLFVTYFLAGIVFSPNVFSADLSIPEGVKRLGLEIMGKAIRNEAGCTNYTDRFDISYVKYQYFKVGNQKKTRLVTAKAKPVKECNASTFFTAIAQADSIKDSFFKLGHLSSNGMNRYAYRIGPESSTNQREDFDLGMIYLPEGAKTLKFLFNDWSTNKIVFSPLDLDTRRKLRDGFSARIEMESAGKEIITQLKINGRYIDRGAPDVQVNNLKMNGKFKFEDDAHLQVSDFCSSVKDVSIGVLSLSSALTDSMARSFVNKEFGGCNSKYGNKLKVAFNTGLASSPVDIVLKRDKVYIMPMTAARSYQEAWVEDGIYSRRYRDYSR